MQNKSNPSLSSEIRWFSNNKREMQSIFESFPFEGEKVFPDRHEIKRTDFYLKTGINSTSVKIREGKHEIKVKSEPDENVLSIGNIEHWAKWSTIKKANLLNSIQKSLLTDWIPVVKLRYIKKYEISKNSGNIRPAIGFIDDGGGVEFTILTINNTDVYTFGLESFGTYRPTKKNLIDILKYIKINANHFDNMECMGYPEYLKRYHS